MSTLVSIAFDDPLKADSLRLELLKMKKEYLLSFEDLVIVTKDEKGKVKLHQSVNLTAAGAAGGSFWGMLVGILFFNPLLGMATGAAVGALSGSLSDYGIDNNFMKECGKTLPDGGSALFVLVRHSTEDKVQAKLEGFGGKILKTSMSREEEEKLQKILTGPTSGTHEAPLA